MADALLSPAVGATFWAGTLGTIAWSARRLRQSIDERMIPLMGVLGAFIFAAQMINFTIPGTGSSGHLGGGMILAAILGPHAAFIVMASVLTVQSFFFADGGLLALGCNIWNLGVYPCFIAYPLIYRPLARGGGGRVMAPSLLAAVAGLQLGAFSVVVQTLLSGKSELPFGPFLLLMQPIHLAIGIVEGVVTAGVLRYVSHARPDLVDCLSPAQPPRAERSLKPLIAGFMVIALVIGGGLSLVASSRPDGLEWAIGKIYGRPGLPEQDRGIAGALRGLQEKTAVLPDYSFSKTAGPEGEGSPLGTSASGIIGAAMVLAFVLVAGLAIRMIRKKEAGKRL